MNRSGDSPASWSPSVTGGDPPVPRNAMGNSAVVIGVMAVVACCLPIGGLLLSVLAIVFGIRGYRLHRRGVATNPGRSVTGMVLGFFTLPVTGLNAALLGFFPEGYGDAVEWLVSWW
ncbi:hypothetical protein LX16_3743 [Stackebrandtia albiflava]|uniref:DUF4190 domain-containing protein n=1 Tax=Stackebrandtia albiflava TaxID=406432 RepID=A0A562V506_9ACTN|nr:DUF4190 domain-containing protein [Stackebrandtia albiflava]TWJ12976.1 hypothetical protein LX16_3743 [Stackebrandtia albiflava]